jgi:nondiscriminating glutamyl-tRNA synthetase
MESSDKFKFIKPGEVRVRFAPSPTGLLHIGSARTCLFNYLFAKKHQGRLILRIEDTDQERSKTEYEEDIKKGLKWLGIQWDEGPEVEGDCAPYYQSQRLELYEKYLKKLLEEDKIYRCFCSQEELSARREYMLSIGRPPIYGGDCANLSDKEIQERLDRGDPFVFRFRVPHKKVVFEDMIRGKVEFDSSLIGDFVIAKSLREPLYNYACVIDDFEMNASHVIRGEDHISNTPKQILLQEALGFPHPIYAHLPLILGPDRSKMSKRHGATSVFEYKEKGYLPEALINFIAFLGWNPGGDREIYQMPSLIKDFSIERIQKGGAVFNKKRLDWLNGFYIRQKSLDKLTDMCIPFLEKEGLIKQAEESRAVYGEGEGLKEYLVPATGEKVSLNRLRKVIGVYQERLRLLSEIVELTEFFFKGKLRYSKELLRWKDMGDDDITVSLDKSEGLLSKISEENWTKANIQEELMPAAEDQKDRGYLLWPLRVALTGKKASAGPFEVAEVLGKEKALQRIREAKELLKKQQG